LHEKSQSVDALKIFITEVERQLERKVKIIRSDRGGEYYGKNDESGQKPGPFAKFLEKRGIVAQYTMPGTPQQNGVAERRNHTLIEMVRNMISHANVPEYLWMYALKTTMYLLNRVPSKSVETTPFELWMGRKPSLRHLQVWGCPAEVRIYNPHEKKFDFHTISGYFIGYPEKSKGCHFYCPNHSTRIVESGNAKFIENGENSRSSSHSSVDIQEVTRQNIAPIIVQVPLISKRVVPNVAPQLNVNLEQQTENEEILTNDVVNEEVVQPNLLS
jgi:hypothetical protein